MHNNINIWIKWDFSSLQMTEMLHLYDYLTYFKLINMIVITEHISIHKIHHGLCFIPKQTALSFSQTPNLCFPDGNIRLIRVLVHLKLGFWIVSIFSWNLCWNGIPRRFIWYIIVNFISILPPFYVISNLSIPWH